MIEDTEAEVEVRVDTAEVEIVEVMTEAASPDAVIQEREDITMSNRDIQRVESPSLVEKES